MSKVIIVATSLSAEPHATRVEDSNEAEAGPKTSEQQKAATSVLHVAETHSTRIEDCNEAEAEPRTLEQQKAATSLLHVAETHATIIEDCNEAEAEPKTLEQQKASTSLSAEPHAITVEDNNKVQAQPKNSEQQKDLHAEFFGMSQEDIEKMELDNEILQGAAKLEEQEEWGATQSHVARKKKERGGGKGEASGLIDKIHPGVIKGKRQRTAGKKI